MICHHKRAARRWVRLLLIMLAGFVLLVAQYASARAQETPVADTFMPILQQGFTPQPTPSPTASPTLAPGQPSPTPSPTLAPTFTATPLYPTQPPPGSTATFTPTPRADQMTATYTPTSTPTATPTATATPTPSPTPPPGSTATPTPATPATATPTATFTPSATPTNTVQPTATFAAQPSPIELLRTVFVMGCNATVGGVEVDPDCLSVQQPAHYVTVNAQHIDRYEVTNGRYKACVDAGVCDPPTSTASNLRADYFGAPAWADYPVINVTWQHAQDFCHWAGGRLPTEAEWERAARHPSDGRVYPWGNTAPTCAHTHIRIDASSVLCGANDPARIGSYPLDQSHYGLYDMGGNVAEWVQDWFGSYPSASQNNPQGPASGTHRIIRGGWWYEQQAQTRATGRVPLLPTESSIMVGFRCAYP